MTMPSRVVLSTAARSVIASEARACTDGLETGGILLGTAEPDTIVVRYAGCPGPAAIRRPDFFLRDLQHARSFADRSYALDRSIWIGEWHTHVHAAPQPSARDLATYQALLRDPELAFDYFVAIILADHTNNWHSPQLEAWILTTTQASVVVALKVQVAEAETSDQRTYL